MAIYSTFFLALRDELPKGFPGWKLPLAVAVRREVVDPFTKERTWIETRQPEWSAAESGSGAGEPTYEVISDVGSYEEFAENRLPPFVRSKPHWAAKGLTDIEIEPLCTILKVSPIFEFAMYAPPRIGSTVQVMPAGLLSALGSADPRKVAARFAEVISSPEFAEDWIGDELTPEDALGLVEPLVGLARRAGRGQSLYLLIEV